MDINTSFNLDGISSLIPTEPHENIDALWGPYASVEAALATGGTLPNSIPGYLRIAGLKFGVKTVVDGQIKIEEYMLTSSSTYKKLVLSEDDVAGVFDYVLGTTTNNDLGEALSTNKIIKVSGYVASTQFVENASNSYYIVSYTDKDGVLHTITHATGPLGIGTDSTKDFVELGHPVSLPENSKKIENIGERNGHVFIDLGSDSSVPTTLNGYINNLKAEVENGEFVFKSADGTPVFKIAKEVSGSRTYLQFTELTSGDDEDISAVIPILGYDEQRQMLYYDNGSGWQYIMKMSNLQIKVVVASLQDFSTTPYDFLNDGNDGFKEAIVQGVEPTFALGDLFLVGTEQLGYTLHIWSDFTEDTTNGYYLYKFKSLGSINNVSLQAKDISYIHTNPSVGTNVKRALDKIFDANLLEIIQSVGESGFFVTDRNGNISFKIDENGIVYANDVSDELRQKITNNVLTNRFGFCVCDENGNVVFSIDNSNKFNVYDFTDALYEKIQQKLQLSGAYDYETYADVYMIPCYGQSLSVNVSAGDSTFNYIEELAYDVNLQNTNTEDMTAGTAEAFRIMENYRGTKKLPNNFKIIHSCDGAGGVSLDELSKGTQYYNRLLASVTTAKNSCTAQGLTLNVPCFTWTQGEEDMRAGGDASSYGSGLAYNPFTYKTRLKKLIEDLNDDIKAITGQTNDVFCISYQTSSHTSYKRYPRIAMQQAELASEYERMILATAAYDIDYVKESTYMVHAYARSYRKLGNMYGIAAFQIGILKEKPKFLHPIHHYANGNVVRITFEVPCAPLCFDTVLVNNLPDGNYGFCLYNVTEDNGTSGSISKSSVTITNVSITRADEVTITLSDTPSSGTRLTYGVNGDYWNTINGTTSGSDGEVNDGVTKSGHEHGARGCLRDSQQIKNTNDGAIFQNLFNWCCIFEIIL